jgi:hypothetical protein
LAPSSPQRTKKTRGLKERRKEVFLLFFNFILINFFVLHKNNVFVVGRRADSHRKTASNGNGKQVVGGYVPLGRWIFAVTFDLSPRSQDIFLYNRSRVEIAKIAKN